MVLEQFFFEISPELEFGLMDIIFPQTDRWREILEVALNFLDEVADSKSA